MRKMMWKMMNHPDFVERADDWDVPLAWYKTIYIRLIIYPVEAIYTWWYWKVLDPWRNVQNAYMRVKKGHDWVAVWNMNDWFIDNAIPILDEWLKDDGPSGHPVCLCNTDYGVDDYDMTYEKWVAILNEMLEGFNLYKSFEGDGVEQEPDIYDSGTMHTGISLFDTKPTYQACHVDGAHYMTFEGVWWKMSMSNEDQKKYQRSLDLFAKYHAALWD